MYTSNRIPHYSGMYHEQIFHDNQVVAQILSDTDTTYWYVINGQTVMAGFPTVADTKAALFPVLEDMYG
jgi:hypothetical protein